jgi:hypothetical protein
MTQDRLLVCSCRMARMLENPPASAMHVRTNRPMIDVKLGKWLVENRRDAEALPILEKVLPACRRMGLHGIQWDAEISLLEALYTLRQRERLLEALQKVVRGYEKRLEEGSCSERDLAEVKSALGSSIGAAMKDGSDADPGLITRFVKLGEALEGESGTAGDRGRAGRWRALMGACCSCAAVLGRYRDDHEGQCLYVAALWGQSCLLMRLSQNAEQRELLKKMVEACAGMASLHTIITTFARLPIEPAVLLKRAEASMQTMGWSEDTQMPRRQVGPPELMLMLVVIVTPC